MGASGLLRRDQGSVKIRREAVKARSRRAGPPQDGGVIENILAAVVGVGLLVYLAYALVHPERF